MAKFCNFKVVIELPVIQFGLKSYLWIQTRAARMFSFEITRMISVKLHSIQSNYHHKVQVIRVVVLFNRELHLLSLSWLLVNDWKKGVKSKGKWTVFKLEDDSC